MHDTERVQITQTLPHCGTMYSLTSWFSNEPLVLIFSIIAVHPRPPTPIHSRIHLHFSSSSPFRQPLSTMSGQARQPNRNRDQVIPVRSFGGTLSPDSAPVASAPVRYTSRGGSSPGGCWTSRLGDKRPTRHGSSTRRNQRARVTEAEENEHPTGDAVNLAKVCRMLCFIRPYVQLMLGFDSQRQVRPEP